MNKGLNAVTYKGIAFQISYDICYPNCDLSPLKIGSIDITKNADLIVQYQSLPALLLPRPVGFYVETHGTYLPSLCKST